MTDPTPIEALEEAVRQFVVATDVPGELSGFVLSYQQSKLIQEPGLIPLVFASDFTMGLSTSPETAIGLLQLTQKRLEAQMIGGRDE